MLLMADLYRPEIHVLLLASDRETAQGKTDKGDDNKNSPNYGCGFHSQAPFWIVSRFIIGSKEWLWLMFTRRSATDWQDGSLTPAAVLHQVPSAPTWVAMQNFCLSSAPGDYSRSACRFAATHIVY